MEGKKNEQGRTDGVTGSVSLLQISRNKWFIKMVSREFGTVYACFCGKVLNRTYHWRYLNSRLGGFMVC